MADDGQVAGTPARTPADWVEDLTWHRRMFGESHFRWVPEDAYTIALRYTRGQVVHETPTQLGRLDTRIAELQLYIGELDAAVGVALTVARMRLGGDRWVAARDLVGLSDMEARMLLGTRRPEDRIDPNADARRALRGWPLPNPLTQAWELRQMAGMYRAAENVLEDTLADLVLELVDRHRDWTVLASLLTLTRYSRSLRRRVDDQRAARGEPGDPRRLPLQRYEPHTDVRRSLTPLDH